MANQNLQMNRDAPENKHVSDPVEEASRESFPASDPPGWVSQRAEDLANEKANQAPMEQLQQLAASDQPEDKAHYQKILAKRDQILTQALVEAAQMLVKAAGFVSDPEATSIDNNHRAIEAIEEYLDKSTIPEIEQRLLALVGTGALFGLKVATLKDDDVLRLYPTEGDELDPRLTLRLARALDRSPDQEPLFAPLIDKAIDEPDDEEALIKASVRAVLDEVPMNNLEDGMAEMIVNSTLGG